MSTAIATAIDIFKGDAFSMLSLTDRINKMPYVPSRILEMGIFESGGVTTTHIEVEERSGTLALIPDTRRGAPANQNKHGLRTVRNFRIPHLPLEDAVLAAEVQNVRKFGGTELQGVQDQLDLRWADMNAKHDATLEYGRLGALKGVILDADGSSVVYNLFTEFGVTQQTVDFDLGTATTEMLPKCLAVKRLIETELGMLTYQSVHAFCGKTWFERFVTHPKVKDAYAFYQANLKSEDSRKGFTFGGITFEEYRGIVGGIPFIADSEAYFHPLGTPGLYKTYFAPGSFWETVNTVGLPRYARLEMMDYGRGVNLLTESNPLSMCTRPGALIKGTTGT